MLGALVTPAFFTAGAVAVSLPILIHLLNRRRFRRVRWAAMDFLVEAQRRNRRRVRFEELVLLALRCLAMLLVGLMLARWFIRPAALTAALGTSTRTERIVLLDDTYSMRLLEGSSAAAGSGGEGATVFARGKAAIANLVRTFRENSPSDPFTLVLMSRPDKPVRSEASMAGMDMRAFGEELDVLRASFHGGNVPASMSALRRLLETRRSSLSAVVYVVSDFQRIDWATGDEAAPVATGARRGPLAVFADWPQDKSGLRFVLVDVRTAVHANLAVTAIEPQQAQPVAGIEARYAAKVTNYGPARSEATSLQVYVGDAAQPPTAVPAIEPAQSADVVFDVVFPSEDADTLTVELPSDPLPVDNTRWHAEPVARALRILAVNGESSADPYADEVFLLGVALRPEGPQFSGNELTTIDADELDATDLTAFHLVILANVNRVNEDTAERLKSYVAAGGGLAVFLGDQVDGDSYNRVLYRDGTGLLPAKLGELVTTVADQPGVPVGELDAGHSVVRPLARGNVDLFVGAQVFQFVACEPATSSQPTPDTAVADRPATMPGSDLLPGPARVLIRLADADRHPLLMERPFGTGRVLLCTSTADKEWNDLADRPVFVVLAMEIVQYLARHPAESREYSVGEPIRRPFEPDRFQPDMIVKTPLFPTEPSIRLEMHPDPQTGIPGILWPNTEQPGLYRFELTSTAGQAAVEPIAVNVDPREGDLRCTDRTSLLVVAGGVPAEYISAGDLARLQEEQARRELWPGLLLLLVVVLMSEQFLAWYFGAGRNLSALWRGGTR
ncbi:MAG TPA: BatA domain-containing protein [Phycisphaerae bacterium]|nr:BatA domain-containing protein [Phycisphaerae bacterium]